MDFEDVRAFLKKYDKTIARLDKVAELVEGFETQFGLELLSTVHWVMKNKVVHSEEDIVEYTYKWNDRKRQLSRRQIVLAANVLSQKGWVDARQKIYS